MGGANGERIAIGRISGQRKRRSGVGVLAVIALVGCASEHGADGDDELAGAVATSSLALTFQMTTTVTLCGDVAGVEAVLADEVVGRQTCVAMWSNDGPPGAGMMATCSFEVTPGGWSIEALTALDGAFEALPCCAPAGVGSLDLVCGPAVTIGVTMSRPPVIRDLTIAPSKFVAPCDPVTLTAEIEEPDGQAYLVGWELLSGPAGGELTAAGDVAWFMSPNAGDFQLRLLAVDDSSQWARLDFPIHVTGPAGGCEGDDADVHGGSDASDVVAADAAGGQDGGDAGGGVIADTAVGSPVADTASTVADAAVGAPVEDTSGTVADAAVGAPVEDTAGPVADAAVGAPVGDAASAPGGSPAEDAASTVPDAAVGSPVEDAAGPGSGPTAAADTGAGGSNDDTTGGGAGTGGASGDDSDAGPTDGGAASGGDGDTGDGEDDAEDDCDGLLCWLLGLVP